VGRGAIGHTPYRDLFGRWWLVAIDGTLQDRGHDTQAGEARYRYVVEAKLVGPQGTMFSLMSPSLVFKACRRGEDGMVQQTREEWRVRAGARLLR
jgi:hypothetical protein